jgi:hypothetical protein
MWNTLLPYVAALLPTVAVGVLFFYVIKYIVEGDRRERLAQAKWEAEQETRRSLPPPPTKRT